MALSGLDIYKLLPKTNCRECGFPTCLAFAMQLAKKAVELGRCPYLSPEAKATLEESSLAPIRLITFGKDKKIELGNETVLFRHEDKFYHPTAVGFIIDDNLSDKEIEERLDRINRLKFERIGQLLEPELVAIRQNADKKRFVEVLKIISQKIDLSFVLMSSDIDSQKEALSCVADKKPLVHPQGKENLQEFAKLAQEFKVPLVVCSSDLEEMSHLTKALKKQGWEDLILDITAKSLTEEIWNLTQIRRLALKKKDRSFGYPTLMVVDEKDPYLETIKAADYIAKYASIVLMQGTQPWQILSLLTLRQNIYSDPQKPLQIEPKVYPVGQVNEKSPVLVTTNFSLTYYTVLGEVEASRIPSYIMSVDTEGMSVLTAWAAEKFTPDKISSSIESFGVKNLVRHNRLVIPGYVAVMSGDLEEKSGWQVIVGPKEASGIPAFLKNLTRTGVG
ncbi:MAG: acetyl-CoA decarbonylase/synthase complex subunit gamma [Candidatus Omnitrophica bacterium]|nr:acetyl-CoA decarbonylase/synthase complex subunit gamma [Candidatus Omnitrophota bacterium]